MTQLSVNTHATSQDMRSPAPLLSNTEARIYNNQATKQSMFLFKEFFFLLLMLSDTREIPQYVPQTISNNSYISMFRFTMADIIPLSLFIYLFIF